MAKYFTLKVLGDKPGIRSVAIDKCARCGQDHGELEFTVLSKAPNASWAVCPETEEPIIISNNLFDYKDQLLSIIGQATDETKSFSTVELRKRFKLMDLLEASDPGSDMLIDDIDMKFLQDFMVNFTGWLVVSKNIVQFLDDIVAGGKSVTRQEEKRARRGLRTVKPVGDDNVS